MSSTYSNLKIQLMATGENSTTWGNVTNTNLGTAIEEAIAGSATVTFASADVTLTLTDTNATQTARHARLLLAGTATSGYNLIVPAIQKPYIVSNGTDGTITVKNSTGTGIAVPAGKTMWVYNNGTNVVDVSTHLTSLTLGTALAVAQGGTGANTASGARTSLGVAASGANSDITSLSGLTTALSIAQGGTGANTAATARTSLGLGTMATQSNTSVDITGGSIVGITDLAVTDGGTGASSAAGARTNLGAAASGTNTDITVLNPASGLQVGSPTGGAQGAGTVNATGLYINGSPVGTGSGSVTSVNASGGTTGLTFSGGPVTTSGTLTMAGTLVAANGGTGQTTYTVGDILYASTTSALSKLAGVATGNTLISGGVGVAPSWGKVGLTTHVSGTLPVANGGTGSTSTTYCSLTTNVTGTLPVANGGTGSTSTTYCSLTANVTGTLPVANGGTGATTLSGVLVGNGTSAFTAVTAPAGTIVGTTDTQNLTNKTLTTGNTLDAGTSVSDTGTIAAASPGFRGLPQNSQTTSYTLALTDAGKHISITTGGVVIPANASIAFPVGSTVVVFNNSSSTQTISITTDTLRQAGTTNTGSRTLAAYGIATLVKVSSTTWVITGNVT